MKDEKIIQRMELESNEEFFVQSDDCKVAMQEQAIGFAEWIPTTNWSQSYQDKLWYSFDIQDTGITTEQLYKTYNNGE
jgi:hypothetical protein